MELLTNMHLRFVSSMWFRSSVAVENDDLSIFQPRGIWADNVIVGERHSGDGQLQV